MRIYELNTLLEQVFPSSLIGTITAVGTIVSYFFATYLFIRSWRNKRKMAPIVAIGKALEYKCLGDKTKEFLEGELAALLFKNSKFGYAKKDVREALIDRVDDYSYGVWAITSKDLKYCAEIADYNTSKKELILLSSHTVYFIVRFFSLFIAVGMLPISWLLFEGLATINLEGWEFAFLWSFSIMTFGANLYYFSQAIPLLSYIKYVKIMEKDRSGKIQ